MLTKVFIKIYEIPLPIKCLLKALLFLSTDENRSSHLCFVPERPLRTSEGDTATLELTASPEELEKILFWRQNTKLSISNMEKSSN